ncbi:MAG: acyl-[ACP]--phospholipid O-acyltransferase [Gammaproteobacteria bacterium]|nr:MAG: acyl-[ACP]--phospholipid O-acyltransferase [Gammaproteobacteria bacterium]
MKYLIKWLLKRLYRVRVKGIENLENLPPRTLIVANHTSFLDALLLYAFVPGRLTFAINTYVARSLLLRFVSRWIHTFALDPMNPLSLRTLIQRVRAGEHVVIFPEGRITVTGALMKIYEGPGMVADRGQAQILPIRIEGAQFTPFSRLKGRVRIRWFPRISLSILPLRRLQVSADLTGRRRREAAGQQLGELMTDLMFRTCELESSLLQRLYEARKIHGGKHVIAEDIGRQPLGYDGLLLRSWMLAQRLRGRVAGQAHVGLLLPNSLATLTTFWAMQRLPSVPAMLNYTLGAQGLISACETATLKTVITSRCFLQQVRLEHLVEPLEQCVRLIYLEDLAAEIGIMHKIHATVAYLLERWLPGFSQSAKADDAAVILFTSGSEGAPKGVVLSHRNLLANIAQLTARVDFSAQDIALNALPLFHSFGLMAGTLLPLLSGIRIFLYPSPLHYRVIPELAYEINATLLFGTNTFLEGYARFAHPYDFYSMRYVFAGAERLQDRVRQQWEEKFGIRILEGYGATETSPVLAANTAMHYRAGTVGRLMPGLEIALQPVAGLQTGSRLQVRGPNIMLGYLLHDQPGKLLPPQTDLGPGWYDTGDIVTIDDQGFVRICGRLKRFAKVGGEMVSLTVVEQLAQTAWPQAMSVAVAVPDERKGEQIILLTSETAASVGVLVQQAREQGVSELAIPRKIFSGESIPLLATGKIDYVAARQKVEAQS